MSLTIGQPAPDFEAQCYDRVNEGSEERYKKVKLSDYRGQWVCLFFYPLDFTAVCPTELIAFNESIEQFEERKCQLLSVSTDSVYSHRGWCESHEDLQNLKYPMVSDSNHQMSRDYGVLLENAGIAFRGTFLINPEGILRWMAIYDIGIGRNVDEILRVLDAVQTDKFCPCNWKSGDDTLN